MKVGLVVIHYPHVRYHEEFISRVRRAVSFRGWRCEARRDPGGVFAAGSVCGRPWWTGDPDTTGMILATRPTIERRSDVAKERRDHPILFRGVEERDLKTYLAACDRNVVIREPGSLPYGGEYHGREGVEASRRRLDADLVGPTTRRREKAGRGLRRGGR